MLKRILDWIENHLPEVILAFLVGFREGTKERRELKKKLTKSEMERKLAERRLEIIIRENALSDHDSLAASILDGSKNSDQE